MAPLPRVALLAMAGSAAVLATACSVDIDLGETVTESFDVADFEEIEIKAPVDATIEVGPSTDVQVEISDELVDRLRVEVTDGRLVVAFDDGLIATSNTPEITITTPELTALTADGAAEVKLEGLDAASFQLQATGAADVTADGVVGDLTLDADGAASVDLDDLKTDSAEVDVDGASDVSFGELGRIEGSVDGAATIDVPDDTTVDVSASGAGSID